MRIGNDGFKRFSRSERREYGVHAPTRAPGRVVIASAASSASFKKGITSLETIIERFLHFRAAQYCGAHARADGKLTRCDGANHTSREWRSVSKFLILRPRNGVNYCDREGTH